MANPIKFIILNKQGPAGTGAALLALLTTNDNSGIRILTNSAGGAELGLWNEDLQDYVVLTAAGTGTEQHLTFIPLP